MPEEFIVKYRAVCKEGDYTGRWRNTESEAAKDAIRHKKQPGKRNHVVKIIVRQTREHEIDVKDED